MALIQKTIKVYILENAVGDISYEMFEPRPDDPWFICHGETETVIEYDDSILDSRAAQMANAEARLETLRAEFSVKEKAAIEKIQSLRALPHLGGDA